MRLRAVILMTILLLSSSSYAQSYPPTSTDLLSAYCIAVLKNRQALLEQLDGPAAEHGVPAPESISDIQRTINEMIMNSESELARLRGYLRSRLSLVEAKALAEAHEAGERDLKQAQDEAIDCLKRYNCNEASHPDSRSLMSCSDKCRNRSSYATIRLMRCNDPLLLPY